MKKMENVLKVPVEAIMFVGDDAMVVSTTKRKRCGDGALVQGDVATQVGDIVMMKVGAEIAYPVQ
ncbi:hypothetical protein SOVF_038240 [Spinacia oleracea]|nr:hypothetical protein SOVF_038240 [Spinacia oleracea]